MSEERIIYLDNAATTFPKPEVVYREMDYFYRNYGGNAGRGANPLARKSAILLEETRNLLINWLDVNDAVFASSATAALNTVIFGARLRSGDIVYLSPFEHNSILRPLEHLRKKIGIELHTLSFNRNTFECNLEEVKAQFQIATPAMICISQVSNVFGFILPVDEILTLARRANPRVVTIVDGSQVGGLKPVNTSLIDAFIFSGHKSLYGPYGVAGIGFSTDWRPEPLIYGGTGTQSESIDMPTDIHSRLEAGSQNIAAIAGLHAALQWLYGIGKETINQHVDNLTIELLNCLPHISSPRIYVPQNLAHHTSIVSFNIEGVAPQVLENALGARNIAVRAGLHCAPWAHRFIGTDKKGGTTRLSIGYFNQIFEIEQSIQVLSNL
ncbi:MAG: cysteine desulfurase [Chloroflexota bacterium]|nr:MAG: cysteine desulfurase [Chloroflexota bacterium]